MMKAKKIEKKIQATTSEISDLQSRLASIENDYSRLKGNSDFDKARDELQSLKSDRDLILEIIQEKQSVLDNLKEEFTIQSKVEERQQTIAKLREHAKSAERLEGSYHKKMHELDSLLQEKIPEILKIRQEWEKSATSFMNLGDSSGLGRGLKAGTAYSLSRNGKLDELNADDLLRELEDKGVNLLPVTSGRVLSSQHFTNISNPKELNLTFGENLHAMMEQSNVRQLLEVIEA